VQAESESELEEMAYVVLADRVGFFGLPSQERRALELELAEAVRDSVALQPLSEPRRIVSEEQGAFALVFFGDGEPAAEAAAHIFRTIRTGSEGPLRVGCHYGTVVRQRNSMGKWTAWGPALAEGRRIMACCDGSSVVASLPFSRSLRELETWEDRFSQEIEREVIQGETLHICSLILTGKPVLSPVPVVIPDETVRRRRLSESTGGAVPPGSRFYISRSTDLEFSQAVAEGESIVLVKGSRQIGKTSLLGRALGQARAAGASVVFTDFQAYGAAELNDSAWLYRLLANEMASQLGLDFDIRNQWDDLLGPNTNFERFIANTLLGKSNGQFVWAIDEVDRLFTAPHGGDFFGLIRSWHNRRALDPTSPWSRLTVAIAHATEAHLFISDLNQSPFNVGVRLELADFYAHEVAELNRRYGAPLATVELADFHDLTGGQPYLCRHGFEVLVRGSMTLREFRKLAPDEDGPFGDHLRRILVGLRPDHALRSELRQLLDGHRKISREAFFRLRSSGVLKGESPDQARLRCQIYQEFLTRHLDP